MAGIQATFVHGLGKTTVAGSATGANFIRSGVGNSVITGGAGADTLQAGDGHAALAQLRLHPEIQLLLSDVKMPGMTGYALVEEALTFRPELKVLMMTAYATDLPTPQALRAREIRTLTKPFEPAKMVELVFDMLSRS